MNGGIDMYYYAKLKKKVEKSIGWEKEPKSRNADFLISPSFFSLKRENLRRQEDVKGQHFRVMIPEKKIYTVDNLLEWYIFTHNSAFEDKQKYCSPKNILPFTANTSAVVSTADENSTGPGPVRAVTGRSEMAHYMTIQGEFL